MGGGTRIGNFIRNEVGGPVSAFYGYQVTGIFQNEQEVAGAPTQQQAAVGRFRYADTNGDGVINADDRRRIGDPNPDFTYGLNLDAGYRNFDFNIFFYGAQGREIVNFTRYFTDFFPSFAGAKSSNALYNSFSDKNPGGTTPIAENVSTFSTNNQPNSYYVEDGSYLRLKNLSIGYTLPKATLDRFKIDGIRVYIQGTNLFTATNYTGLDPEVSSQNETTFGLDFGSYPNVKQFLIGLNLNF